MGTINDTEAVTGSLARASFTVFHPVHTIRCTGARIYRSQAARDLACLLDVDRDVVSWECMPKPLEVRGRPHVPDFGMVDPDGRLWLLDAPDRHGVVDEKAVESAAAEVGGSYRLVTRREVYGGYRLKNARDLLRYGGYNARLGDRIRLLAALDEQGSSTLAECMCAIRETQPIAGIAVLILGGFIEVDLDSGPLGPETVVRRIRA